MGRTRTRPATINIFPAQGPVVTKLFISIFAAFTLPTPLEDPTMGHTLVDFPLRRINIGPQLDDSADTLVATNVDFGLQVWD